MNKDDFQFPQIFLDMDMLGWTVPGEDYVWFNDMEWYTLNEIVKWEEEKEKERHIVNSPLIIPFAHTGGGDVWGWYIKDIESPVIVQCYHDDIIGTVYAKNLEEAIFRHILDFVSDCNFYTSNGKSYQMDCDSAKECLLEWRNKFGSYFKSDWINEIDKILTLNLKHYKETRFPTVNLEYETFLTPQEAEELIQKYLKFDKMDTEIVWEVE